MAKTEPGEAANQNKYHVLVDSDAFISWLNGADILHEAATQIFGKIKSQRLTTVTTSLVVVETATVLSNRMDQGTTRAFLDLAAKFPIIHITEQLQADALQLFKDQGMRGTSVVDCANVVVMQHFNIPQIFSFDKFYKKRFGLKTAA